MANSARWRFCVALAMLSAGTALVAGPQKKTGAPAAPNLMAKVPMKLGYYVPAGERCSSPTYVMKFGPNSFWHIYNDGNRDETRFVSVTREGDEYSLNFPRPRGGWEEQDPQATSVLVKDSGRIDITTQDTASLQYCPPEQVPARFKTHPR